MGATRSPRTFGFDVFRSVALAVVLATHGLVALFVSHGFVPWTQATIAATFAATVSIDWFFALSGCLIGAMMIRGFEASTSWWASARAFWLRRWFRTLPNYALFLLVNVGLVVWGLAPGPATWQHAVFAQNLAGHDVGTGPFPFFVESWSLAVEEWFYLLAPLLLGLGFLLGRKHGPRAFLFAAVLLVTAPPILRLAAAPPTELFAWDEQLRRAVVTHLDAPGWGVLAAITSRWAPRTWASAPRLKFGLGVAATALSIAMVEQVGFGGPLHAFPRLCDAFVFTFAGLGVYLALPWLSGLRSPTPAAGRTFAALADWSYSIYLVHIPLLFLAGRFVPPTTLPAAIALTLAWATLTIALAAAIFTGFERPISRLRERFAAKVDATPFTPLAPPAHEASAAPPLVAQV